MVELFSRYRNTSSLVGVLLLQIGLLAYQVKHRDDMSLLQVWTAAAMAPLQKGMTTVSHFVTSSWNDYIWLIDTRKENRELRRELGHLKIENHQLQQSASQLERKQLLMGYQETIFSQSLGSQVIGVGSNPNSKEIVLDLGTDAGVQAGMAVVTPDGIAGKVNVAYGGASMVLLINDPEVAVGVLLANSRTHGVLRGTGSAFCEIDYVSREVEVRIGEKVYTSGGDRIYPKGLPVGTVTRLEQANDFQRIYVDPAVSLDQLEEVLVITAGVHQDLPISAKTQPPVVLLPAPPSDSFRSNQSHPHLTKPQRGHETVDYYRVERPNPNSALQTTDVDRLRRHYALIGESQGHKFGEAKPGSIAPNFNPQVVQPIPLPSERSATHSGSGNLQHAPVQPPVSPTEKMANTESQASGSEGTPSEETPPKNKAPKSAASY